MPEDFNFQPISDLYVPSLLKSINIKKAIGPDFIILQLIKAFAYFFPKPLTVAINYSIRNRILTEEIKLTTVVPFGRGNLKKSEISNYRLVSLLNIF